MKQILGTLLILIFSNATLANTGTYDIDLLIFSHITPQTLQAEQWPALSNTITGEFDQNSNISMSKKTYQLQHEENMLQRAPGYSVLYSGSTRQTWNNNDSSITIPVKTNELTGNITVTLGHYFDVRTDLLLTEPTDLLRKMDQRGYFSQWERPTFQFHFLQNRRMRSRELNYLGSPLIGVLIKMKPVN